MNANAWVGEITAPLAVALGLLACFLGYRLLKVTLGIMGFVAGAGGGWAVGMVLAPANSGVHLLCAFIGAVLGVCLYVWLFYLGIFLLGAGAGVVVAAAVLNVVGNPPHPILVLALALVFGVLALLIRKFMIVASTALSGSYLVTAGLFGLIVGIQNHSPLWLDRAQTAAAGSWGYVAFLFWLVLGLAGMKFQYRVTRAKDQPAAAQTKPA